MNKTSCLVHLRLVASELPADVRKILKTSRSRPGIKGRAGARRTATRGVTRTTVAGPKWEAESRRSALREHERRTTANSGVGGRCCPGTGEGELDVLPPEAGTKQGCWRDEVSEESRCSP